MKDTLAMRQALDLAARGRGWVNPNPMVGAVIVRDGRIIGSGWHAGVGGPHAERAALADCRESPRGATLFVTLEPCCHQGRTPPCTDAILERGIARVVVGSADPNPLVAGKGIRLLQEQGVQVETGVLREECDALNRVFFHYITHKTPFVISKFAMTLDGKIATRTGASQWITGETARAHAHGTRHACAAVMAGIGTVLADNPLLTCRMEGGSNPVRVICDTGLRIPLESRIATTAGEVPTIIAAARAPGEKRRALEERGCTVLTLPDGNGRVNLRALLAELGRRELDSVLLEGGGTLHYAALEAGLVQQIHCYLAPKIFGGRDAKTPVEGRGVERPEQAFGLGAPRVTTLGEDLLLEYDVRRDLSCLPES